jgi:Ni,Fe-hydrogenase I cytochrome b subunit
MYISYVYIYIIYIYIYIYAMCVCVLFVCGYYVYQCFQFCPVQIDSQ